MGTRRNFITKAAVASAAVAAAPLASFGRETGNRKNGPLQVPLGSMANSKEKLWNAARFPSKFGIGGVAIGNGFHVNTNEQITHTLQTAWDAGVRYYDTSPFYGVDLRTVALQFSALHPAVGSVIPGASLPEQAKANVESFAEKIPADLWRELKAGKLIEENAPVGD
ncbi:aldo/keto reductase [Proteiniphilum acetatigenes]|uniref:aldo/keto reductase n=1 Tax=Proteiniphilum acetatigenes TaxID=294710 RepID=UPI000373D621|nr:aldo/keto reductase [Proteiniphilum acetatigenes]SFK59989.1 Tat (twin-arginine translocation) pathway signal sequence [Porphyromonadaceae bacterium KH3CP3RA]